MKLTTNLALLAFVFGSVASASGTASILPEHFATAEPFAFTRKGRENISGTSGLRVWRADSWDADSSMQLSTVPDPERPFRQALSLVNLGPARSSVLWLPKQPIQAGVYRLEMVYRTQDDRWALLDLVVDGPAETYQEIRIDRTSASRTPENSAGRRLTLLPTSGANKSFTIEFRITSTTAYSVVIGHAGLGHTQPLIVSVFDIVRVSD